MLEVSMQAQFTRSVAEEKWNRSSFSSEFTRVIKSSMPIRQCIKNTAPEMCNKYHKPADCYASVLREDLTNDEALGTIQN
jgi:hypothetical protein